MWKRDGREDGVVRVRRNAFSNELHGCYFALQNLFVCGAVQVGTWLEADLMVSNPLEFLMASASAGSRVPQAQERLSWDHVQS